MIIMNLKFYFIFLNDDRVAQKRFQTKKCSFQHLTIYLSFNLSHYSFKKYCNALRRAMGFVLAEIVSKSWSQTLLPKTILTTEPRACFFELIFRIRDSNANFKDV